MKNETDTWTKDRETFWRFAVELALILIAGLTLAMAVGIVTAHGNISVYSYGTNYVIWDVGGNTLVWIDGTETAVSGLTYGQYELQPGTEHIACNVDGNCTGITTKTDSILFLSQWLAYFVIIAFAILAAFIPLAIFPGVLYVGYLVSLYMPQSGATGNEYIFVSCLTGVMLLAAFVKMRR